jgi:broad specificity phosphatase PhoE
MGILGRMDRPLRLVLIRHGETPRNRHKTSLYFADEAARSILPDVSYADMPLTEKGRRQAKVTGAALRGRFGVPDCVYHSGFQRTVETTAGILSVYGPAEREHIRITENTFVRERDSGYTYNMTTEEATRAFPWLADYWRTHGGFFARPPGGESFADVVRRVYLFLDMLFRDCEARTVFVVTHGGTKRCFRYLLERWSHEQMEASQGAENCAVTVYGYSEEEKRLMLEEANAVYWR